MKKLFPILFSLTISFTLSAQFTLFKPDRVFDGEKMHTNWQVLVEGNKIKAVGSNINIPNEAKIVDLKGTTLMPGMIEGHAHILLHPYNEVGWNDQVLKQSITERVVRATVHAKNTLLAGFTTIRDLGSEGAEYADVGIKKSIEKGIIPGPRMLVAGKAIVTTGSYGPKGFAPHVKVPLGAEEADGQDHLIKVVRDQIGKGADVVKVYADYRWGPNGEAMATFTQAELNLIVEVANSSGRPVVAHAATPEGMKRATLAGVQTIEHGDGGTKEVFELMAAKGVALCPTIAAGDAISQYRGWNKATDPEPKRVKNKRKTVKLALDAGVPIVAGGDVGVYTHGTNAIELELMVDYGMTTASVLKAVTAGNAKLLNLKDLGELKEGKLADIIAVEGNPMTDIKNLRKVKMVMKDGKIYKN
jgi:imidazolonepropionase-like amidohydrolase